MRSFLTRPMARLRMLLGRHRLDEDTQRELEAHLEALTDRYVQEGLPPEAAVSAARRQLGNLTLLREDIHRSNGFPWVDDVVQDVEYALRGLRRSPAFSVVAVASLALGIGANAAIFAFVNAVLIKRLPGVTHPDRLVTFAAVSGGTQSSLVWPLVTVDQVASRVPALDGVFGRSDTAVSLGANGSAQWISAELVTGQYFQTLGVTPEIGRLLTEDDVRDATADPVCVLGFGLWQRVFNGSPDVLAQLLLLNDHPYRVVGVAARGFYGTDLQRRLDVVIPATRAGDFVSAFSGERGAERMNAVSWLAPMARLRDAGARAAAEQQTNVLLHDIDARRQADYVLEDGSQGFNTMRPSFGRPVLALMGIVILVLLVACANLANLLLARAQVRAQEFAVRIALGATRARLIGQLLIESCLLAAAGGTAGILLSVWITDTVLAFLNSGRPSTSALHVTPDGHVLAFLIVVSFATVLFFGLVPALQATKPDLVQDLKQEQTTSVSGRMVLRRSLIVAQVTISVVVTFAAGLMARTLTTLNTVDLGYEPDHVLALNVEPSAAGHSPLDTSQVFDEILTRARGLPFVAAASLAAATPTQAAVTAGVVVPGFTAGTPGAALVSFNFVSPQYFATLGQALLRGRDFSDTDDRETARVAIVNRRFVEHFLDDREPIGFQFRQGPVEMTIVGIVEDSLGYDIRSVPDETVYIPVRQAPAASLTLLARSDGDPRQLTAGLTGIIRSIDSQMPILSVRTLDADVQAGLSSERILSYLSMLFAALALLLAGIGLHGLVSYSVTRRTREIGIRMAVGAEALDIGALFLRETGILVLLGVVLGVPLAFTAARVLRTLLFGVTPTDPASLAGSVAMIIVVSMLGMIASLWRATRVDAASAMRTK